MPRARAQTDADAIAEIFKHSRGTPRLVNILADTALVYGYAEESKRIDATTVREVITDKKRVSILLIEQLRVEGAVRRDTPIDDKPLEHIALTR